MENNESVLQHLNCVHPPAVAVAVDLAESDKAGNLPAAISARKCTAGKENSAAKQATHAVVAVAAVCNSSATSDRAAKAPAGRTRKAAWKKQKAFNAFSIKIYGRSLL
jgi:hypothetical protein